MTLKQLQEMKLHETRSAAPGVEVLRVPGGWIYNTRTRWGAGGKYSLTSVFVPEVINAEVQVHSLTRGLGPL